MFSQAIETAVTVLALILFAITRADASDGESLIYLAESGPLVIRLHVESGGKSHSQIWQEYAERMFERLDRDGDDHLNTEETRGMPTVRQLQPSNRQRGNASTAASIAKLADTRRPDGIISRDEFLGYLERYGRPFQVTFVPRRDEANDPFGSMPQAEPELFSTLDVNRDERLSVEEFTVTPTLRKLDLDDDETVSRAELAPATNPYLERRLSPVSTRRQTGMPFVHVPDRASATRSVMREILRRYDRNKEDGSLSRSEMGMSDESFDPFDIDENGHLDFDELTRFVRRPTPDVNVFARSDNPKGAASIEIAAASHRQNVSVRQFGAAATLDIGNVQLKVELQPEAAPSDLLSGFQQQFTRLDRDGNGYLEATEVKPLGITKDAFQQMDVDGDEKVFEAEFTDHFERVAAIARSRTSMTVTEQGNLLFEILDTSRDGRLSRTELTHGRTRIKDWDKDRDGRIAKAEIPDQWKLTIVVASPYLTADSTSQPATQPLVPQSVGAPIWFLKMDRNSDGELTRREFLGESDQFARIDSNADGVIHVKEAGAVRAARD